MYKCFVLALGVLTSSTVLALTTQVPADQPTIQAGINVATDGDTVLVAPGMYSENIVFHGKRIVVRSIGGYRVTTIQGVDNYNPVVAFVSDEPPGTEISGFRITGGMGGGVGAWRSCPTITGNEITGNFHYATYCGLGAGGVDLNQCNGAIVSGNIFHHNVANVYGGSVFMNACSSVVISHNISFANDASSEFRGIRCTGSFFNNTVSVTISAGLELDSGGYFAAYNNIICFSKQNPAFWSHGGQGGTIEATYNCLYANGQNADFVLGTTNILLGAGLMDTALGDFRLAGGSPCVDAGDPDPSRVDPDGSRGDIGAIPYAMPGGPLFSSTIRVPQDRPTIQKGIDDVKPNGLVLVSPGIYSGNIWMNSKAVHLKGQGGPDSTIIADTGLTNLLVITGPGSNATTVEGFTFKGGHIGIWCRNSGPTIQRNVLDSQTVRDWAAICLAGPGYPMATPGPASARIINNTIMHSANGGISTFSAVAPVIRNNIIAFAGAYAIHLQSAVLPLDAGYNLIYGDAIDYINILDTAKTIASDPLLTSNYHLTVGSPCIDAGDPSASYNDADGSRNDIGAFPIVCCQGHRGNIDLVGTVDLSDLSYLVSFLSGNGLTLPCWGVADVNGSNSVDIGDLSWLVKYLTSPPGTMTLSMCN